ncbi:MAG TPA: hypothetical protein VEG60_14745 [Candidatus Binatia bacterium]|nr:hypothetical protein [Candidatus Binatia bacterium]
MTEVGGQKLEVGSPKLGFSRALTLSSLPFALCFSASAQQPGKIPRIGLLDFATPEAQSNRNEAFGRGLRELGYFEGENIIIEYRSAGEKSDRLPELADELVALKVDVIVVAGGEPVAQAAKQTTQAIHD